MNLLEYTARIPERQLGHHRRARFLLRNRDPDADERDNNRFSSFPSADIDIDNLDRFGDSILSYNAHSNPPDLVYVRDHERANTELSRLFHGKVGQTVQRVVGFDVEWRPNTGASSALGENPVAVVQIAATRKVLVLHLSAMEAIPAKLIDFLKDGTILKAGVNILGDAQRMYRDFGATVRSCVELSYLARTLDPERWPGNPAEFISLARLVSVYLNRSLSKTGTRRSNWDENVLSPEQINYAANDAHASQLICTTLLNRAHHLDRSLFTFDVVHASAVHADGLPWEYQPQHIRDHLDSRSPSGAEKVFGNAHRPLANVSRGLKVRHLRARAPTSTFKRPGFENPRPAYRAKDRTRESEMADLLNRLKQLHLCSEGAVIKEGVRTNVGALKRNGYGNAVDLRTKKTRGYSFF
ncbi:ribonuclease H-like protein [Sanghuangporus baumii]|uniref:Ribonuclease H-like protein n=1 Tax=Sanghuangporus baumii TaxID=108892 RepID=A0A9Q5HSN6_SANBA|nr:ribonuclease H-like protein [Sanghuangporus baumii]